MASVVCVLVVMLLLLTESVYANTTVVSATTTFPSGIRPPPDASMSPSEDKSDWDKYGLPIVLLLVVLFVFGAINWAVFVLPETTCWKKLTNYKQLEEEDTSPLGYTMKRRNSLKKKLQKYRQRSKAAGWDGLGGTSNPRYYDLPPSMSKTVPVQVIDECVGKGDQRQSSYDKDNAGFDNDEDYNARSHAPYVVSFDGQSALIKEKPIAYVKPVRHINQDIDGEESDEVLDDLKMVAVEIHHGMSNGITQKHTYPERTHAHMPSYHGYRQERNKPIDDTNALYYQVSDDSSLNSFERSFMIKQPLEQNLNKSASLNNVLGSSRSRIPVAYDFIDDDYHYQNQQNQTLTNHRTQSLQSLHTKIHQTYDIDIDDQQSEADFTHCSREPAPSLYYNNKYHLSKSADNMADYHETGV